MSQKYLLVNETTRTFFEGIPPSLIGSVRKSLCIPEEKKLTARRGNLIYSPENFLRPFNQLVCLLAPWFRLGLGFIT